MASDGTQEKLTLIKKSVKKYSQEMIFSSSWGDSKVQFSITVNTKGIITSISVKNIQSGVKNAQYFKKFESNIGKKVVWKNIKTLTLWAVWGASDTTRAFGSFISSIGGRENVTPTLKTTIQTATTGSGWTNSWQSLSSSGQTPLPQQIIRTLSYTVDGTLGQVEIMLNMSGSMIQSASSKTVRTSPKTLQAIKKFNQEFAKSVSWKNIRKIELIPIGWSKELTDAFIKSIEEFQEKPEIRFTFFGSGQIMGSGNTINCSSDCTTVVESKQEITLEARAGTGYVFDKWAGTGVTSTGKILQLWPTTESRKIEVYFKKEVISYGWWGGGGWGPVATAVPLLNLGVAVIWGGKVTSNPVWIDCGTSCSQSLSQGTNITLTAIPTIGNIFSGWSGDCSGTAPTCNVSMSQARNITATFTPEQTSWVKEETVSYSVPGWLVTQVRFKVTYDSDKILQSAEAIYVSGDTQSQTFIPSFNDQASTLIIGQKLSDLTDVIILGGASLTTVAFRDFIRSI
jgi:Divergent InlB B-repeat domain